MQRVAVNKIAKRTRLTLGHPRHAKEIPFHVQRLAVWSKVEPATDQDSRRPQAKSYRPVHECKTSNGRQTDHEPVSQIDRLKFGEGDQNGQDRGKNAKQGRQRQVQRASGGFGLPRLARRLEQTGQHDGQGIFDDSREQIGRHQRIECSAEHAAERHPKIEPGEVLSSRPFGCQPSVTDHCRQKQKQQVNQHHRPGWMRSAGENLKKGSQRHHREQPAHRGNRKNLPPCKYQDE